MKKSNARVFIIDGTATATVLTHVEHLTKIFSLISELQIKLEIRGIDPDRLLQVFTSSRRMTLNQVYQSLIGEQRNAERIQGMQLRGILIDDSINDTIYKFKRFHDECINAQPALTHKQRQPYYQKFNKKRRT